MITEEEQLKKATPFACHEDDIVIYDKQKKKPKISIAPQKKMKEPESIVVNYLKNYHFLNAKMIRDILSRNIGYPPDAVKDLLAEMTKEGLVTRCRISYRDVYDKEHRSPYIYMSFTEKSESSSYEICSYLAFNQCYFSFTRVYANELKAMGYGKGRDKCDGKITFSSNNANVSMVFVTSRRGKEWQEKTYQSLHDAISGTNPTKTIMVVCESEIHALEIEKMRTSYPEFNSFCFYYICDFTFVDTSSMILQSVIKVLPSKNEYEICTIPIDSISDRK